MPSLIRSVTRYIPSYGLTTLPCARLFTVRLVRYEYAVCIVTDFACFPGSEDTTEDDLARTARGSFATESEAKAEAWRLCPFAGKPRNEDVREELLSARHHDGDLVGTGRVADAYGVSSDAILAIARGERKAPKRLAQTDKSARGY